MKRLALILLLLLCGAAELHAAPRAARLAAQQSLSTEALRQRVLALKPSALYDLSQWGSITAAGGLISQLTDLSGNGRHATQSNNANKPTLSTPALGINGRSVAVFDGVDDSLTLPAALAAEFAGTDKPITIIGVFQHASLAGTQCYLSFQKASDAAKPRFVFYKANTTNILRSQKIDDGATEKNVSGASAGVGVVEANLSIVTLTSTGLVGSWFLNGALSGTADQDHDVGAMTGLDSGAIGSYATASGYFNGKLLSLAVFNRVLSADERAIAERYFAQTWGLR